MKKGLIGVAAGRSLLLIWGLGISAILLLLLVMDVRGTFQPEERETAYLQFPCPVADTPLVVEGLVAYDGAFVEDGSDTEVTNVMAVLLRNTADQAVTEATVQLEGSGRLLVFQADSIPAGARALVLEKYAAAYERLEFSGCTGWVKADDVRELIPQQLRVETVDMGTLKITNLTDESMRNITLYYKTRSPGDGIYIGGITYQTVIDSLEPSQSVCISPYHYAGGYSCVVKATAQ